MNHDTKEEQYKSDDKSDDNFDDKLVDLPSDEVSASPSADSSDSDAAVDTRWDPVKSYLRSIGSIDLLTREEEVEIAKQIESAQTQAIDIVWNMKLGRQKFINLLGQLKQEEVNWNYVFDPDEIKGDISDKDELTVEEEEEREVARSKEEKCKIDKLIADLTMVLETHHEKPYEVVKINPQRIDEVIDLVHGYSGKLSEAEQNLFLSAYKSDISKAQVQAYLYLEETSADIFNQMLADPELNVFATRSRGRILEALELIEEIKLNTLLSVEEFKGTIRLLKIAANKANKAKSKMIRSNLRLVVSIAKKYLNRGLPFIDLMQEGGNGIIRAVSKFRWDKGCKFSTYATCWIKQSITRAISDKGRLIRLPVHMLETRNRIVRIAARYFQEHGVEPTDHELSELSGLPVDKVKKTYSILKDGVVHLETTHIGDGKADSSLLELIADDSIESPLDRAIARSVADAVSLNLGQLNPREERIMRMRNGLEKSGFDYTLEKVGQKLGVTRERVRQVENRAWNILKNPKHAQNLVECIDNAMIAKTHAEYNKELEKSNNECKGSNAILGLSPEDLTGVKKKRKKRVTKKSVA